MKGRVTLYKPGTWHLTFDVPPKPGQQRSQKKVTFKGSQREAEMELSRLLAQAWGEGLPDAKRETLAAYLDRWMLETGTTLAAKTQEQRRQLMAVAKERIGHHQLSKLKPLHLHQYYNWLRTEGSRRGGGVSEQTVLHHHRILSRALGQAVRWGLLQRNPAELVDAPRPEKKERRTLEEEDALKVLQAAKGTAMWFPALLLLATGLRRGELLGLRWEDVDWGTGRITVKRQRIVLSKAEGGSEVVTSSPKTHRSKRPVSLPPVLLHHLKQEQLSQLEREADLPREWVGEGWIVCQDHGKPWSPQGFYHAWKRLLAKAGVEHISVHEGRHTQSSWLFELGVPVKAVSDRLGHSTVAITSDLYTHMRPKHRDETADALEPRLRRLTDEVDSKLTG